MFNKNIVIDACSLINLDASGHLLDIIKSLPVPVFVTNTVWKEEIITLEQIKGDTGLAISNKMISVIDFDEAELINFIHFAVELGDDGEAATFAVAVNRGWAVATDDKAAINYLKKISPKTEIVSTLEIVALWAEASQSNLKEVKKALLRIKDVGRYIPSKNHKLYEWWHDIIESDT